MFHGFSESSLKWLHKNYVITVSLICNRFYVQMFHCWTFNYNCARSFFMQSVGIDLLCNFFTCRFFIILIQSLSFFIMVKLLTWVLSHVLLFNWLILSFLWFFFFFSLAIMVQWFLPAVDICILFSVWCSVWRLTLVLLDIIQFECSGTQFE